ncbi:MAG TPA: hypothetical protein VEP46_13550 [Vicinamibacterales bacterium]|nr:hypothetical protein [Vicinamibacterales bacterium]
MRSHWIIAALLSSALAAGCNGRNNDNSQNTEQNQAAAPANAPAATDQTVAPAPPAATQQPYTTADNSAVRTQPQTTAPRATTGRRDVPRATTPSRTETAPPANSSYGNSASNAPAVGLPPRENTRAEAPAPRLPEFREVTIPAGTALPLEMTSTISSESAQVEAPVSARLRNALTISGDTAIPAGSVLRGTVTDVERAGRVQGRAHLSFAFNEVSMSGGREDLKTNPLTFEAEASKGEDATKVGAGAVGGAILGGILGGKKGAAKGAAGGAAAGTGVVLATRGKEVTVTEGTNVTATLAQPMTVRVRVR